MTGTDLSQTDFLYRLHEPRANCEAMEASGEERGIPEFNLRGSCLCPCRHEMSLWTRSIWTALLGGRLSTQNPLSSNP